MKVENLEERVKELSFHLAGELKDLNKVRLAVQIAYGSMVAKLFEDVIRESVEECFMENRYANKPYDDGYGGG